MAKYEIENSRKAPRTIFTAGGPLRLMSGGTATAELTEAAVEVERSAGLKVSATQPGELPALTGKNKAQLLDIAEAEGVDADDDMTKDAIRDAIEAKRNG